MYGFKSNNDEIYIPHFISRFMWKASLFLGIEVYTEYRNS